MNQRINNNGEQNVMRSPMNDAISSPIYAPATRTFTQVTGKIGANTETMTMVLKITFSIVPIVAGLDKFTNLLTDWEKYLNPMLAQALPFSPHIFMWIVGVIEI